jgi:hypothetical protein
MEPNVDTRRSALVLTLQRIDRGTAFSADVEDDLEERGLIVQHDGPYASITAEGRRLIEGERYFTIHPYGDEWVWDETGEQGLVLTSLEEARKTAGRIFVEYVSVAASLSDMWFDVWEWDSRPQGRTGEPASAAEKAVAYVTPDGVLHEGPAPVAPDGSGRLVYWAWKYPDVKEEA